VSRYIDGKKERKSMYLDILKSMYLDTLNVNASDTGESINVWGGYG